ncbi:MAG: lipoyl synthase [Candidatus Eisenbacteria bacterium]
MDDPRLPPWLVKPLSDPEETRGVRRALKTHGLSTVCDEARCPNRVECFARGTATFMILGDLCTRDCGFCAVGHGAPVAPDRGEPARVAAAARELGLGFVVLTSVTRDDLPDGGADHFARTVRALREALPEAGIEVLVPDFAGDAGALDAVMASGPDVLGHNVETVERLYDIVRRGAGYARSLGVLERAAASGGVAHVKSALMLGLGEERREVESTLRDVRATGADIAYLGQYLRPSARHAPVERFVPPGEFEELKAYALSLGFGWVSSGPFVRSSYHAESAVAAAGSAGANI